MRRAVALRGDFSALAAGARELERRGVELAWLDAAPLLTAAALASHTTTLRFVAAVDPDEHPLALAEAAVVASHCLGGRLVLFVEAGETADAVRLALSGRPFRFAGARWTIPANRPENDGATAEITVTPPADVPVWTERPRVIDFSASG